MRVNSGLNIRFSWRGCFGAALTDRVLHGGAEADEVYAGLGGDDVLGDAGDAFIEVKDGETGRTGYGPGTDSASVDREDLVSPTAKSRERVPAADSIRSRGRNYGLSAPGTEHRTTVAVSNASNPKP
jgi:hypothetical protein